MVKIKICGLFREEDIDYANEAGPDFAGFVFAESRRRVFPAQAARLRSRLREGIIPVGVFVNAPAEEIAACYRDGVIGIAQLHGSEDAAYISRLKTLSAGGGRAAVPVIKTLRIGGAAGEGRDQLAAADYLLLDSGAGSGKPFDWNLLNAYVSVPAFSPVNIPGWGVAEDQTEGDVDVPQVRTYRPECGAGAQGGPEMMPPPAEKFMENGPPSFPAGMSYIPDRHGCRWFLAGGVSLENISRALSFRPFGIDVSSGAETDGVKDRKKMIDLVNRVRKERL
jgi:phosphoribosylanthranilate isomerase